MNSFRDLVAWCVGLFLLQLAQAGIPIQHWTQPSGAQVFLVESAAIPMLDVQVDFDAGNRRDPPDQAGLADVVALMVSKGVGAGSTALDESAISDAWADLGGAFGASASLDRFSFSLRTLTSPDVLGPAVALAARQIAEPTFSEAVWQRERERMIAALQEASTRPATIAARVFHQAVYGDHPYGFDSQAMHLWRISAETLLTFYRRAILPCRAKVTLVGALQRSQADALVTQLLARLPAQANDQCTALPQVAEVKPLAEAQRHFVPMASAQAHVLLGQPGFKRDDPDYFALVVGNYILGGGGFVSRLTDEVRQKRGLSYSVSSAFEPGLHAGAFTVGLQTRPDQVEQALRVAQDVISDFVRSGPTEAELKAAKANLVGGFALRLDSNRKLLDNVANIAWYGLSLDYLATWTRRIEQLDVASVRAAFQRHLKLDNLVSVVVGPSQ
ncbi:MAG: hypothetical protein RLZZ591_136 [Pseudomonadota bacterium]|jgi:zinc protease